MQRPISIVFAVEGAGGTPGGVAFAINGALLMRSRCRRWGDRFRRRARGGQ